MSSYPSHTYQFEYANSPSASHYPQLNLNHRPYLPQDDNVRPAFFSYSPDVVKHRKRTSRAQRKILEEAFRQNPKPSQYTRKLLIHQTGMDRRSLQVPRFPLQRTLTNHIFNIRSGFRIDVLKRKK